MRLTEKVDSEEEFVYMVRQDLINGETIDNQRCLNKLGEYEDAEDNGLLYLFNCQVGDTIYIISHRYEIRGVCNVCVEYIEPCIVDSIVMNAMTTISAHNKENKNYTYNMHDDYNSKFFLSDAEAYKKISSLNIKLTIGKLDLIINKDDLLLDNLCYRQLITQRKYNSSSNKYEFPTIGKTAFQKFKELGFLYTNDELKKLGQSLYPNLICTLYRFDINKMIVAEYEVITK